MTWEAFLSLHSEGEFIHYCYYFLLCALCNLTVKLSGLEFCEKFFDYYYKFNVLNSYMAIPVVHFFLSHFWKDLLLKNLFISSTCQICWHHLFLIFYFPIKIIKVCNSISSFICNIGNLYLSNSWFVLLELTDFINVSKNEIWAIYIFLFLNHRVLYWLDYFFFFGVVVQPMAVLFILLHTFFPFLLHGSFSN